MKFSLLLVAVISGNAASAENLRASAEAPVEAVHQTEHLDLEVTGANGERELFPLLPGTR